MQTNLESPGFLYQNLPESRTLQNIRIPGESAVGKSSLVLRFVKGQFHEFQVKAKFFKMTKFTNETHTFETYFTPLIQESTIGAAFLTQTVCLDDTTVKFEIWDTAGQERLDVALLYFQNFQS